MKGLFLLAIFFASWGNAVSQVFPSEVWHEGKVVLISGDTVMGLLKYNLESDLIQVNTNNVMQTYSSRKIIFYEIFDVTVDNFRQFYALPYNVKPNYKVPIIFEVLYEGPLTLLARESIVLENNPTYNSYYRSNHTRRKLVYNYYFLNQREGISRYGGKKKDLIFIMRRKSNEVKKFMKKNHLRHDKRTDLIKITTYYNNLIESS